MQHSPVDKITKLADQVNELVEHLPSPARAGILSHLSTGTQGCGAAAAEFLLKELILARAHTAKELKRDPQPRDDLTIPPGLSKGQEKTFQRVVEAVASRLGTSSIPVSQCLTEEFALLRKPESGAARGAKFPNASIIIKNIKDANLFDIREGFDEILRAFAREPSVALTAATLVMFSRVYADGAEAKTAYDAALRDATEVFGSDLEAEDLVRTAGGLVFIKKYKSINEAKAAYDAALRDATEVFGRDPLAEGLIRTAAALVFNKKYESINEAKTAYDAALRNATEVFGSDPQAEALVRTAACLVFTKNYESINEAKAAYDPAFSL